MGQRGITKAKIIAALREGDGFVTRAADLVPCSVATIYNYINRYDDVRAVLDEMRERKLDEAEGVLSGLIAEGDRGAVTFYLRTIGKHRGYVEKTEMDNKTEMTITVRDEAGDD